MRLIRRIASAVAGLVAELQSIPFGLKFEVMELETVLQRLRAHEADLRASGIESIAVFGSTARGEAGPDSDVDLLIRYDPLGSTNLIKVGRLREHLAKLIGKDIDLLSEPILKSRLRNQVYRDHVIAF
jgi:predicted nucleotidyltransferase